MTQVNGAYGASLDALRLEGLGVSEESGLHVD
jgi:hypothetical protein